MKRKTTIRPVLAVCVALVLLCASCAQAAEANPESRVVLEGMGEMRQVAQSHYLYILDSESGLWGVFDTDGNQLLDYALIKPSYAGFGCFTDQQTSLKNEQGEKEINNKALFVLGSGAVSGYEYGVIKPLGKNWLTAWKLTPAADENCDYKSGEEFYNIERCDIYALDGGARLAASLSYQDFKAAQAHGKYISVADREDKVTLYDAQFLPSGIEVETLSDSVYEIRDYMLFDRLSGLEIMDGVTGWKEIDSDRGNLLLISRKGYDGGKLNGLCTLEGEWLVPMGDYTIKSVSGDYAVLSRDDRLGLYCISRRSLVIPCQYEGILANKQAVDPYAGYGYVCALSGTVRYYYSLDGDGEEEAFVIDTASAAYSAMGLTLYEELSNIRFRFTAANGESWQKSDMNLFPGRGDGSLFAVRSFENSMYGVMTMDGRQALSFKLRNKPVITDDGRVIVKISGDKLTSDSYQLIEIIW